MPSPYPIGNLTYSAGLPQAQAIIQRRTALDVLEKSLRFPEACFDDKVAMQQGRTVQWYRPNNFPTASLAPAVEGDIPTGLIYTARTIRATLGNYTDYVALSSFLTDTSPTPDLQDAGDRLGYRGALRVDDLTKRVIDAESTGTAQAPLGTYLTAKDLRNSRTQLSNANVQGMAKHQGMFWTVMSPVNSYDLVNDPTVGGLLDITKYNMDVEASNLVRYQKSGYLKPISGCLPIESTNVTTTTSGGNTYYRVYVFGEGGYGKVTLNIKQPQMNSGGGQPARFNVTIQKGQGPTPYDPTGEMGGFASYNFDYTACCMDGNPMIGGTHRNKTIDIQSSVA